MALISLEELVKKDIKEPEFFIAPYIVKQGVALLWARRSVGKSALSWRMAAEIGRGGHFFGLPVKQGKVLYIEVSEPELLARLSGRWICRQCQQPYHTVNFPPKIAGVCDKCGGELYQRADDTIETARKRLEVYFDQTTPLIDYYGQKSILATVNGEQQVEQVGKDLMTAVRK